MKHILKEGFSINEAKFSVIVLMTLITFGITLYQLFSIGHITKSLLDLLQYLLMTLFGVNVANGVTGAISDFNSNKDDN